MITLELQRLNDDALTLTGSNYRVCPHCGQIWYKEPAQRRGNYGGRMGCDGSTTCGSRMGQLDIPDNGGLRFNFTMTTDRRDMTWSRGSFGAQSSLTYINSAMAMGQQTQVNVDISNASRSLRVLDGMYINNPDGTYRKVYTYYLAAGEQPCMTFLDGYWKLSSRPGGDWCFRQAGTSGTPPGGEWELAPRLMEPQADLQPSSGSEWMATLCGVSHRVRVTEARPGMTHGWYRLKGISLNDGTPFNKSTEIEFVRPATSCRVKVTKAVGCGKPITWSQMAQADPEIVRRLGLVDSLEETGCAHNAVGMELREDLLERGAPLSGGDPVTLEDFIDSDADTDERSVFEL